MQPFYIFILSLARTSNYYYKLVKDVLLDIKKEFLLHFKSKLFVLYLLIIINKLILYICMILCCIIIKIA